MSPTTGEARQRYEELRKEALADQGAGLGLALLLRKGLAAWLRAWAQCAPPPAPVPGSPREPFLPPPRNEAVRILAAMALSQLQEAG